MSRRADAIVWESSRAGGIDLLVLLAIADWANDDGRDAFPSPQALARKTRMTDRGVRKILHRLERTGEIAIDLNTEGRALLIGRRELAPEWFIHVRCVANTEAYLLEASGHAKSEQRSETVFRRGRPSRIHSVIRQGASRRRVKPEQRSEMHAQPIGTTFREIGTPAQETGTTFREIGTSVPRIYRTDPLRDPVSDPSIDTTTTRAGAAAAMSTPFTFNPDDPIDALAIAWNALVEEPLKPVLAWTLERRADAAKRLAEHSLEDHRRAMQAITSSAFCAGENRTGFIASFDWYVGKASPAQRALEGRWRTHFPQGEIDAAVKRLTSAGPYTSACNHEPRCPSLQECPTVRNMAFRLRWHRRSA